MLVLDDMHNGDEITVTGICMEMIERMAKVDLCVYPPPRRAPAKPGALPQMGTLGRLRFPVPPQALSDCHGRSV